MSQFVRLTPVMSTTLRRSTRLLSTTKVVETASAGPSEDQLVQAKATQTRLKRSRSASVEDKCSSEETTAKSTKKRVKKVTLTEHTEEDRAGETKTAKRARKATKAVEHSLSDFPQRSESLWKSCSAIHLDSGYPEPIAEEASTGASATGDGVKQSMRCFIRRIATLVDGGEQRTRKNTDGTYE